MKLSAGLSRTLPSISPVSRFVSGKVFGLCCRAETARYVCAGELNPLIRISYMTTFRIPSVLFAVLLASTAFGQTFLGNISGTATDATGAAVAGGPGGFGKTPAAPARRR